MGRIDNLILRHVSFVINRLSNIYFRRFLNIFRRLPVPTHDYDKWIILLFFKDIGALQVVQLLLLLGYQCFTLVFRTAGYDLMRRNRLMQFF